MFLNIEVKVDSKDWEASLDRMVTLCREAGFNASLEAAQAIQRATRALLLAQEHAPHTKTPSVPGTPPAAISGELAASVIVRDDGEFAEVGPTTDYGRIQEMGGTMHGNPFMKWQEPPGVWHSSAMHDLPSRPFLKPGTDSVIESGELTRIYYDHWARAQAEAAG